MKEKKYSYMGTLIAITAVVVLILLNKFVYKEDYTPEEIIYEPTERESMEFFENTQLSVLPTE